MASPRLQGHAAPRPRLPRPVPGAGYLPHLQAANPELLGAEIVLVFHPGMLFGSRERWWGDPRPRPTPHEGLDLWCVADAAGREQSLPLSFRVPAAFPGVVVRLLPDFLGLTVCLRHERREEGACLYSLLGHLRPRPGLGAGTAVAAGEILGTLAAPAKPTRVPPHLHLTLALLPPAQEAECLNWEILGRHPGVRLVDPLPVLGLPYRVSRALRLLAGPGREP